MSLESGLRMFEGLWRQKLIVMKVGNGGGLYVVEGWKLKRLEEDEFTL